MDLVKVRLQVQNELLKSSKSSAQMYNGMFDGLKRIISEEGFLTLFQRGITASMARELSYSSVRMGAYDPIKAFITRNNQPGEKISLVHKILAGASSGAIGSFFANPCDIIKIRQQAQGKIIPGVNNPIYRNFFHAISTIYKTEGFQGLYRGVGPTTLRASVLTAAQLSSYDHSKFHLLKTGYFSDNIHTHFLSSFISGFVTAVVSSPVDVIKTRYMNDRSNYKSAFDCFIRTVKSEGVAGLYRGFLPNFGRLGPHFVLSLPLLEQLRLAFGLSTM